MTRKSKLNQKASMGLTKRIKKNPMNNPTKAPKTGIMEAKPINIEMTNA